MSIYLGALAMICSNVLGDYKKKNKPSKTSSSHEYCNIEDRKLKPYHKHGGSP